MDIKANKIVKPIINSGLMLNAYPDNIVEHWEI